MEIAKQLFGSELAIDHSTYDHKAQAVVYAQNRSAVINLLVLCDWLYPVFQSQVTPDRKGDTSVESKLFSAVTGLDITEAELNRIGERVWNLMRSIAVLEGQTREKDTLHASYFQTIQEPEQKSVRAKELFLRPPIWEKKGSMPVLKAVPKEAFEKAKDEYYMLRGWDIGTGWPTGDKLRELGLEEVAKKLFERGLLP